MDVKETLDTAAQIVLKERDQQYSTVTRVEQHERIAKMWSGILHHTVTGHQVALCMVGLKLVRADNAPNVDDSYVDACGYAAIAAEIAEHNRQPEQQEDTAPIETIRYGG